MVHLYPITAYGYVSDGHQFSGHYWLDYSPARAKSEVRGHFANRRVRQNDTTEYELIFHEEPVRDPREVWDSEAPNPDT